MHGSSGCSPSKSFLPDTAGFAHQRAYLLSTEPLTEIDKYELCFVQVYQQRQASASGFKRALSSQGGDMNLIQEERGASSPQSQPRARVPIPPDTILIGRKPIMAYATAVMMHFQSGAKVLSVKARGRAISTAVDVVEVVRRRFFAGKLVVKEIAIGTEALG